MKKIIQILAKGIILPAMFFSNIAIATTTTTPSEPIDTNNKSPSGTLVDANGHRAATASVLPVPTIDKDKITVIDASARPSISGNNNSAAYISLHNGNKIDVVIVGAIGVANEEAGASSIANRVEMHMTTKDEKDMSKMVRVNRLVVPADGDLTMASGGIHIMLLDLKRALKDGDTIYVNLVIQGVGMYQVKVPVKNQ